MFPYYVTFLNSFLTTQSHYEGIEIMPKDKKKETIYEAAYDDMAIFENFFSKNWEKIFQLCGLAVIGIAIFLIANYYNKKNDASVAMQISTADGAVQLQEVISKYATHPAVATAKLRLAQIYLKDKKYDEASKIYTQLSFSKDPAISLRAKLNQAYIMEIEGKKAESAAKFAEIGAGIGLPEEVRFEASYSAARIYKELGEGEKAKTSLESFNNINPMMANNFWVKKGERLKALIK